MFSKTLCEPILRYNISAGLSVGRKLLFLNTSFIPAVKILPRPRSKSGIFILTPAKLKRLETGSLEFAFFLQLIGFEVQYGTGKPCVRMSLDKFLSDKKSSVVKKWRNLIIGTYPTDTQRFLKKEKNKFSNPVGHSITEEIEVLYEQIIKGEGFDKISAGLDNIIRVRAVQDFKPSEAVGFLLGLKKLIKEELLQAGEENDFLHERERLDQRIDDIALLAFDIYSLCRQKLYEVRVNEVRNQVGNLLKKANLTIEFQEPKPSL